MDNIRLKPTPLPVTADELMKRKTMLSGPSLNDDIDRIHITLWSENPEYRRFLESVFDEDTVEGSKIADDLEAAAVIKEFAAARDEFKYIARKNKMTIVRSLNVVMRRYHMSRKERAMSVSGETVSNGNAE